MTRNCNKIGFILISRVLRTVAKTFTAKRRSFCLRLKQHPYGRRSYFSRAGKSQQLAYLFWQLAVSGAAIAELSNDEHVQCTWRNDSMNDVVWWTFQYLAVRALDRTSDKNNWSHSVLWSRHVPIHCTLLWRNIKPHTAGVIYVHSFNAIYWQTLDMSCEVIRQNWCRLW